MAASANLSGGSVDDNNNHNNNNSNGGGSGSGSGSGSGNGNGNAAVTNGAENTLLAQAQSALRHNPGLSVDWTPDEDTILKELLTKHASESIIACYAIIAMELKNKSVRDIALRCRWMSRKENGKRRKGDHNLRKSKEKKVTDSAPKSQARNRTNGPPYAQSIMSMDSDDGISFKAIGDATGQLLEQNAQALDQISSNFTAFKIDDNINLFSQAWNNILTVLNDLNDMPDIMKQMTPFPVKVNEDLANSMLPRVPLPNKS